MNPYVRFDYKYRDGANYKNHGDRYFPNPDNISIIEIQKRIELATRDGVWFIAKQIGLPELFLFRTGAVTKYDHCFHEFDSVKLVSDHSNETDERSISEFLDEIETAAKVGWQEFSTTDIDF